MIPYRKSVVRGDNTSPVEGVDDLRRGGGAMYGEEAERDEKADERVKDGVLKDLADEIEGQVMGPGFGGRRGKTRSGGDGLHFGN